MQQKKEPDAKGGISTAREVLAADHGFVDAGGEELPGARANGFIKDEPSSSLSKSRPRGDSSTSRDSSLDKDSPRGFSWAQGEGDTSANDAPPGQWIQVGKRIARHDLEIVTDSVARLNVAK